MSTAALLAVAGCAAFRLVFDVPPPDPTQTASRASAPETSGVVVDTTRVPPPIELVVQPDSVLAMLPVDAAGGIDWAAAIHEGVIDPLSHVPGTEAPDPANFGYDFYFGGFETFFPHSTHVKWAACASCHPKVFRSPEDEKAGMSELREGQACGVCHGTVAFGLDRCERCHQKLSRPEGRLTASLANDVVFVRDTTTDNARDMRTLPPSIFPHWAHRIRYQCQACHESIFPMEVGGTQILMDRMQMGENCGACHNGDAAFGVLDCGRCHKEPPDPVVATPPAADTLPTDTIGTILIPPGVRHPWVGESG